MLLAACMSPREQCVSEATRDLNVLRSLISESETNLKRGYANETVTTTRDVYRVCVNPNGEKVPCWVEIPVSKTRAKAIDLDAERRKLASMRVKERELARTAARKIATCKATNPE